MHYAFPTTLPPTIVRSIILGLNNVPPIFPHGFLGSLGAIYHRTNTNGWAPLHSSSRSRKTAFTRIRVSQNIHGFVCPPPAPPHRKRKSHRAVFPRAPGKCP